MNGLELIDEKDPSFADRLLKREPSQNAFIEINNVIASSPIREVSEYDIERILTTHNTDATKLKPRFKELYSKVLRHFIEDFRLADEELADLAHLQTALALTPADIGEIHSSTLYPIFQNAIRNAIFDNRLTTDDEIWLDDVARKLNIPESFVPQLYATVVQPWLQTKLDAVLADGRLSPLEEAELARITNDLKAMVSLTPEIQWKVERARNLWRLGNGEFPRLDAPIYLNRGEFCAAYVEASLHELRTIHKGIETAGTIRRRNYTYFNGSYESINMMTRSVSEDVFQKIDLGALYFTNERLFYNGARNNFDIPLVSIIGAEFYTDGMNVDRLGEKDLTFMFTGDPEALKIIFDTLMTRARR